VDTKMCASAKDETGWSSVDEASGGAPALGFQST
jgi:hypothetical protein